MKCETRTRRLISLSSVCNVSIYLDYNEKYLILFCQDSKEVMTHVSSLGADESDHNVEDMEQMHIAPEEPGKITYLTISCNGLKTFSLHFL